MALKDIVVKELPSGMINDDGSRAILPAGKYFLGDNGYLASENSKAWSEWVEIAASTSQDFTKAISGAMYGEYPVLGSNTAYSDGVFTDNMGHKFSVDSGMIGLTPLLLLEAMQVDLKRFEALGTILEFTQEILLYSDAGTIEILSGPMHLMIPTGS